MGPIKTENEYKIHLFFAQTKQALKVSLKRIVSICKAEEFDVIIFSNEPNPLNNNKVAITTDKTH